MHHFPIYKNSFPFTNESMLHYLLTFDFHVIEARKISLNSMNKLLTKHMFEDRLVIEITWNMKKNISHPAKSMIYLEKIKKYMEDGELEMEKYRYVSFSKEFHVPNQETYEAFQTLIQGLNRKLHVNVYHQLEYQLDHLYQSEETEFTQLKQCIDNNVLFEQYLQQVKKDNT